MSNAEIVVRIITWLGITMMFFVTYYNAGDLIEAENYIEAVNERLEFISLSVYVIALSLIFRS